MTVAAKPTRKFSYQEALNYRSARRPLSVADKIIATFFIVFYLTVVCVWLLDEDYLGPVKNVITPYTKPAMGSLGWVQYWGLFSPYLRNCNYHSTATIEFADGTTKLFEFPKTNIDQKDYFSHFGGEKKRKLFGDNMLWNGYEQFLPSIARYVARANDDVDNPPRMVTLSWHFINTPAPDPNHWVFRDQLPYHTEQITKFVYKVEAKDLPSNSAYGLNPEK